ncbi:hypothetical protein D1AOALGA4SA_1806 [Olavius algarvensis Delta 1 endosymbiont]|nr:hypothetical protein D1AOALGA4SA_1806 [Olavius algarvensis Delta 1 endosymbiont]
MAAFKALEGFSGSKTAGHRVTKKGPPSETGEPIDTLRMHCYYCVA